MGIRSILFRLATWRDPRNVITDYDDLRVADMRANPSIENELRMKRAIAAYRYVRQLQGIEP